MAIKQVWDANDLTVEGVTFNLGSNTTTYIVSEADDEDDVRSQMEGFLTVFDADGRKFQDYQIIDRISQDEWRVSATYALDSESQSDEGQATESIDVTGQSVHITNSLEVVASIGMDPTDRKGAIGFDGQNVQGADIIVPGYNFQLTYVVDDFTQEQKIFIAENVGKTNSDEFRGFAEGEVLFLGCQAQQQGDGTWRLTYQFSRQPNETDIAIGDLTVPSKKGWELLDIYYANDAQAGVGAIKPPKFVYVHRVYDEFDFDDLDLPDA